MRSSRLRNSAALAADAAMSATKQESRPPPSKNSPSARATAAGPPAAADGTSPSRRTLELRDRWLRVRELVLQMREQKPAPVDTMGCHVLPPDVLRTNSIASQNLQVLFSLLLSSQTKDQYTFASMQALRAHFHPDEITPDRILAMDDAVLDGIIKSVGFHTKKTSYMKQISALLLGKELNGQIPDTLDALVSTFPGIGPKMGILYLQNAKPYPDKTGNAVEQSDYGLAVDTHVLRLSQQFRLVFPPSSGPSKVTPEVARAQLERIVPQDQWRDANPLLVGFGQTVCGARTKSCGECLIAGTGLCKAEIKSKAKKVKVENAAIAVKAEDLVGEIKTEQVSQDDVDDGSPNGRKRRPTRSAVSGMIQGFAFEEQHIDDIEDLVGKRTRVRRN